MKYYSTNKQVPEVSFEKAIFQGLPDDNGLYMPKTIKQLPAAFFENIHDMELHDIAYEVAKCYIEDEIPEEELRKIVAGTLSFDLPLVEVEDNVYALELYHGPTCAFKDVGARFLARCLSYFSRQSDKKATILVATSGDTGSAVASGFLGMKNINVVILYPKGKISKIQEQQLTTLGENITACEVEGTFDDCQKMVKDAFLNLELKEKYNLTSANSINMARLVPQSFYYFWTYAMLGGGDKDLFVSVPSGNYGNLTAGLLAKKMGLPIKQYIASANANDIVPAYLRSGNFEPRRSVETISNAMDVGNPSNFYRMNDLFGADVGNFRNELIGYTYSDEQTADTIKQVYGDTDYLLDPHGAVGYLGLKEYMKDHDGVGVFLETAHPAKFLDVVEPIIAEKVEIPQRLQDYIEREKVAIEMDADLGQLESILEKL